MFASFIIRFVDRITLLVVALALVTVEGASAQIVNPANGHTYLLTSAPSDVFTARAEATALGGYLTTINDAAENAWLVANFSGAGQEVWIGLSDEVVEGSFAWDNGETATYSNWFPGQPDNDQGVEDHVELDVSGANVGTWNDVPASHQYHGIIEISAPLTPTRTFSKISNLSNLAPSLAPVELGGGSLTILGDLDLDGAIEIVSGDQSDGDGGLATGAIRVLFTSSAGAVTAIQKISATSGGFTGSLDPGDGFGRSVTPLGDLDGDGVLDLAVGAYQDDDGGLNSGAVWILFMNANGTVSSHQKISASQGTFPGPLEYHAEFGTGIASLGDLNGDGVVDLAVGAPEGFGSNHRGAVWVLFMQASGQVASAVKIGNGVGGFAGSLAADDRMGYSVASIGDVDGDGVPDIAAGAPFDDDGGGEAGCVWIIFLNANGTAKNQQKISPLAGGFPGSLGANDRFGQDVTAIGDRDGDGIPDIAVGAPNHDADGPDRGAVWEIYLNSDGTAKASNKIASAPGLDLDDGDRFGDALAQWSPTEILVAATGDDDGGADLGAFWICGQQVQPPSPYPGSGEDFILATGVNGPVTTFNFPQSASVGDYLTVHFESPTGAYDFTPPVLYAQLFQTGIPPFPPVDFPEVHLDFAPGVYFQLMTLYSGYGNPFSTGLLPPGGMTFSYAVPGGLSGLNLMIQAFVVAPSTNTGNGWFTATDARAIQFN